MDEKELEKAKADEATMLDELRKRRDALRKLRSEMDLIEEGLRNCRAQIKGGKG